MVPVTRTLTVLPLSAVRTLYVECHAPEMGIPLRSQRYFNVVPLAHPETLSAFSVDPTKGSFVKMAQPGPDRCGPWTPGGFFAQYPALGPVIL